MCATPKTTNTNDRAYKTERTPDFVNSDVHCYMLAFLTFQIHVFLKEDSYHQIQRFHHRSNQRAPDTPKCLDVIQRISGFRLCHVGVTSK